ncbi:alpha/beta hydrolase [Spirillospora albida]|uniref:alpha/beta hydrolase n=1 Tax=Spirillospora albida TaxID=58123 RepID=UPI0004BFC748|nr:alpha/beta hydrolase [Spirillospora albida]
MPSLRRIVTTVVLLAVGSANGSAGRDEPYAPPAPVPELSAATLDARYAAAGREIGRAEATAERIGDTARVRALAALRAPGRRFLAFDARGGGRVVEVIGDLARADRIAVLVPGADNTITVFDDAKFAGGGARALHRQAGGGTRLAVVAWLGYASPSTRSTRVLTGSAAADGSRALTRFLTGVHRVNGNARLALLCHSYGGVVCGKAARHVRSLPVDDIALFGSPGTTFPSAAALRAGARVWAGRSDGDWIAHVPHVRVAGLGLGADPVSPGFGALRFDAGKGPHSGYLRPGSTALRNLAGIALGAPVKVMDH